MPKKPAVSSEDIFSTIQIRKYELIDDKGKLLKPSSQIWKQLQQDLNNKISAKYIYTIVQQNRYNILHRLGLHTDEEFEISDSDVSTVSNSSTDTSVCSTAPNEKKFQIILSAEQWKRIQPFEKIYRSSDRLSHARRHLTLKCGVWTNVINEAVWQKLRSPCVFIYKRARVYKSGKKYVNIEATCKECKGKLKICCDTKPHENENVSLKCKLLNFQDVHSCKVKRSLSGQLRKNVSEKLLSGPSASVWREEEASRIMEFGDPEPSTMYTQDVLRKAKQEASDAILINKESDPLKSLQVLKHSQPYFGSIRDIGLDRFFVHYWTKFQIDIYNKYHSETVPLCIDATGSVAQKLTLPYQKLSGHIFLYMGAMNIPDEKAQFPVLQMLSARHDTNSIVYWMGEWIRSGAKIPKQVVCDSSKALLSAAARVFGSASDLQSYIKTCFDILTGKSTSLPTCFIRIDLAHFIKNVCNWKSLKNKDRRVREFFIRSTVLLIKSDSLSHSEEIIKAISCVSKSPYDGFENCGDEKTSAEIQKSWLKSLIASEAFDISFLNEESPEDDQREIVSNNAFMSWAEKAVKDGLRRAVTVGDKDNLHYLPNLTADLLKAAKSIPLWSALMVPQFQYGSPTASSAVVESEFNHLKTRQMPLKNSRVDKFVARHLNLLDGKMKLVKAITQRIPSNFSIKKEKSAVEERICESRNLITDDFEKNKLKNVKLSKSPFQSKGHNIKTEAPESDNSSYAFIDKEVNSDIFETFNIIFSGKKRNDSSAEYVHDLNVSRRNKGEPDIKKRQGKNELNYQENWKGLILPPKKRRSYYLAPFPEIAHHDDQQTGSRIKINLLKNGNIQRSGKKSVLTSNTCPYDAFCQSLAAAYCDSLNYQHFLDSDDSNATLQIVKSLSTGAQLQHIYSTRATVLHSIFRQQCSILLTNQTLVDAVCNVTYVVDKAIPELPSGTETRTCSSKSCIKPFVMRNIYILPININIIHIKGISHLQEAIEDGLSVASKKPCMKVGSDGAKCEGLISYNLTLNNHIFIEIGCGNKDPKTQEGTYPLNHFPVDISIKGKYFYLRSVVAFISPLSGSTIGHYTAYCKRLDGMWELYDDLQAKVKVANSGKIVYPHLLIYTI